MPGKHERLTDDEWRALRKRFPTIEAASKHIGRSRNLVYRHYKRIGLRGPKTLSEKYTRDQWTRMIEECETPMLLAENIGWTYWQVYEVLRELGIEWSKRGTRTRKLRDFSTERLEELIARFGNVRRLSKYLGCYWTTTRNELRRRGIQMHGRGAPTYTWTAEELHRLRNDECLTYSAIAKMYGSSISGVKSAMQRFGVDQLGIKGSPGKQGERDRALVTDDHFSTDPMDPDFV